MYGTTTPLDAFHTSQRLMNVFIGQAIVMITMMKIMELVVMTMKVMTMMMVVIVLMVKTDVDDCNDHDIDVCR